MAELATSLTATEADRLNQAEGRVRDYCGWHIAPSREEEVTFAYPRGERLMLPSLYVTAVESVVVDGVTLLPADYLVHQHGWIERLPRGSRWTGDLVEVTYTHGYTDVPPAVTAAVQALAQGAVDNPGNLVRRTDGPFTDVYAPGGTANGAFADLGAYRIVRVA